MRSLFAFLTRRWPFVLAAVVVLGGLTGLIVYNTWIKAPGDVTNEDAEFQDTADQPAPPSQTVKPGERLR